MADEHYYEFGPFRVDPGARLLLRNGEMIPLPPKAVHTLLVLLEHHGELVEKEDLMRAVWPDTAVEENNLNQNISILRKVLREGNGEETYIETIPKRGYRFLKAVECPGTKRESLPARRPERRRWVVPALAVMGVAVAALAVYSVRRPVAAPQTVTATFTQVTDQAGEEVFPSLSPSGRLVCYASRPSGRWDVFLKKIEGGNAVNLTAASNANNTQPAFSPSGEQIAFRSDRDGGGIFLMDVSGGSVRRLADFGYNPAWSWDGKEIACGGEGMMLATFKNTDKSRVFAVNIATGEKRAMSSEQQYAVQPSWSPQGRRIAFWEARDEGSDIWTVSTRGGPAVRLTTDGAWNWNPVWSPDGRYLYFSSERSGSMNLWRVRIEEESGRAQAPAEPLTTPTAFCAHMSFSRAGDRLAYVNLVRTANLHKVGFDPGQEVVAGAPQPLMRASRIQYEPDVSPDDEWLAFDSRDQGRHIFAMRTDGSQLRQLTQGAATVIDRRARWSPDGRTIAFQSSRSGSYEIWSMNPDGSGLRQLTQTQASAMAPTWSPDARRLAFGTYADQEFRVLELAKEPPAETLLSTGQRGNRFLPWSWSPDGRKLAGHLRRISDGEPIGVAIYDLERLKLEKVTETGSHPRWLSDGRRLLYNNRGEIHLVDTHTGRSHRVLSVAPNEVFNSFAVSHDNRAVYFCKDVIESDIWLADLKPVR